MRTHLLFAAVSVAVSSCCVMQIPRTLPPGETSIGVAFSVSREEPVPWPTCCVRHGAAPHVEYGLTSFGLGGIADVKASLCDYFALGVGGGASLFPIIRINWLGGDDPPDEMRGLFVGEGSVYVGYPIRRLYPYGVVRYQSGTQDYHYLLSVVGVRMPDFFGMGRLHLEGGVYRERGEALDLEERLTPIVSVGVSTR